MYTLFTEPCPVGGLDSGRRAHRWLSMDRLSLINLELPPIIVSCFVFSVVVGYFVGRTIGVLGKSDGK